MLISYFHFCIRNLMMITGFFSLCNQRISHFRTMQECNTALQTERKKATTIHNGSQCQISQSENSAPLANTSGVEMIFRYLHFSPHIALTDFNYLRSGTSCEDITIVEKLLYIHTFLHQLLL